MLPKLSFVLSCSLRRPVGPLKRYMQLLHWGCYQAAIYMKWKMHSEVRKCFVPEQEVHVAEEVQGDTNIVGGVSAKDGHAD